MILGESAFVYRITFAYGNVKDDNSKNIEILKKVPNFFISYNVLKEKGQAQNGILSTITLKNKVLNILREHSEGFSEDFLSDLAPFINSLHVDVSLVNNHNELDIEGFRNSREEYKDAIFISENGIEINNNNEKYIVGREVEKMSKSKYNVVNPDDICQQYGADTLRMYEMFLGPLEQAKPWNTAGITGVHGFLKKLWKLYHSGENESFYVSDDSASKDSLKTLHKTIKKVQEDIEAFSFNTSVSSFMIAVNELSAQKCNSREVLEPLAILISPYAPHIAEELWQKLGHSESISAAPFPKFDAKYLVESTKEYPISFNGKMRFTMELPLDLSKDEIESAVMAHEKTAQYLQGRTPKKIIVVPGKIVNIVG